MKKSRANASHVEDSNHITGTVTGESSELLKPLLESFNNAREAMSKELNKDPAPEFSHEQIEGTTKWLHSIVRAMDAYNKSFSKLGLMSLDDQSLDSHQELARESSRQLTILFADEVAKFSGDPKKYQITEFGKGGQSQDIRDNLQNFTAFLKHFGEKKWLGDLVAPEFAEQKDNAVKLLEALQNPPKTRLRGCGTESECVRCRQITTKTQGFCTSCNQCAHGYQRATYPAGCPRGCCNSDVGYNKNLCAHGHRNCGYGCPRQATVSEVPDKSSSLFHPLPQDSLSSSAQLEQLAKMATTLAEACRKDALVRAAAGQKLEKKMDLLKNFAEAMNKVPEVLRRFLLIRSGTLNGELKELKPWVSKQQADEVHKQLERFRDEATEAKLRRSLQGNYASSCASWEAVSNVGEAD